MFEAEAYRWGPCADTVYDRIRICTRKLANKLSGIRGLGTKLSRSIPKF